MVKSNLHCIVNPGIVYAYIYKIAVYPMDFMFFHMYWSCFV